MLLYGRLLVWEECHYEPARYFSLPCISRIESTETLPKEWEGHVNSPESQISLLGCPVEDKVCALINKMMMNNQDCVVGEGYAHFSFPIFCRVLFQLLIL